MNELKWQYPQECQADGCIGLARVGDLIAVGKNGSDRMHVTVGELLDLFTAYDSGEYEHLLRGAL